MAETVWVVACSTEGFEAAEGGIILSTSPILISAEGTLVHYIDNRPATLPRKNHLRIQGTPINIPLHPALCHFET